MFLCFGTGSCYLYNPSPYPEMKKKNNLEVRKIKKAKQKNSKALQRLPTTSTDTGIPNPCQQSQVADGPFQLCLGTTTTSRVRNELKARSLQSLGSIPTCDVKDNESHSRVTDGAGNEEPLLAGCVPQLQPDLRNGKVQGKGKGNSRKMENKTKTQVKSK